MSDLDDNGFDWVEESGNDSESPTPNETSRSELYGVVEELRKENARLKEEKQRAREEYVSLHEEHAELRGKYDEVEEERDALQEEIEELRAERNRLEQQAAQADALEELQQDILEIYGMLSEEYNHGVPRQMLIGTVQECCDANDESVERALRGLMNTGDLVENQQHIHRPEDVENSPSY